MSHSLPASPRRWGLAAGLALLLAGLLAACGPAPTPAPTPRLLGLRVTIGEIIGPVQLQLPGAAAFVPAAVGAELPANGQVQTGPEAQARLDLADGAHLRLAPNTLFSLPPTQPTAGRTLVQLVSGKLWASLTAGPLDVVTPGGYASLTGAFAIFEFLPGDPATGTDDTFIVSCLTGACALLHADINEQLSHLDQVILTGGTQVTRSALDPATLTDFREQNPLVALNPANATPTDLAPPATPAATADAAATVSAAATAIAAATLPAPTGTSVALSQPPPADTSSPTITPATAATTGTPVAPSLTPSVAGQLGRHIVQSGETIYCISRAYGVLPNAIAQANDLVPPYAIFASDVLTIPAAPWANPPAGAVCAAQFPSPYLAPLPATATALSGPAPTATPALAASAEPGPTAQIGDGVWFPPVNLSRSGAAEQPVLAVEATGRQYALWWDRFDGARFATFEPGVGWSAAAGVPSIVGATPPPAAPAGTPVAPIGLRLLADGSGGLHAFWLDTAGDLRYAQNLTGAWSANRVLAVTPLRWEAAVASGGRLHLAYLRTLATGAEPPGVYYQQSSNRGIQWTAPHLLVTSPYFRTLAERDAHLDLALTTANEVFITWDDPQLLYSFYAASADGGGSFAPPAALASGSLTPDSRPRRARFVPLGSGPAGAGGVLRLWELAPSCTLYQEARGPSPADPWGAPVRTLEQLPGCLSAARSFPLPGGGAFLLTTLAQTGVGQAFVLWDGQRWAEPLVPRISFVNPATNRPAVLGCLAAGLSGDRVVALGCDARGDIWGTASQLSLSALLPALSTAWSPPVQLSSANAEAGLPSLARDAAGRLHALWTEVLTQGSGEPDLVYARFDAEGWTSPTRLLSASDSGPANTPQLAAGPGDRLYVVWSGGLSGQVHFSRAFTRDAAVAGGWLPAQVLPAPRPVGGWPAIAIDGGGRLRVLFTIPFNEDRGLYLTESVDDGQTWSEPQRIFDAAAAGWSVLQDTQLVVDASGGLHVLVARGALPPAVDPLGVYALRSTDDGRTWTGPEEVSARGSEAGYPRLSAPRPGELHRLWLENVNGAWLVQHQWSRDDGATWGAVSTVPGLRNTARNLGLATDGRGALYLVGIEPASQQSAALFYLRWDGARWVDRETVPLGFGVDAASAATALLLPSGHLGVLYRVAASAGLGPGVHLVGYTQRPIAAVDLAPLPTFTPPPAASATATTAPTIMPTPSPTLDLTIEVTPPAANGGLWRILVVLAVTLVIAGVAVVRLTRRR